MSGLQSAIQLVVETIGSLFVGSSGDFNTEFALGFAAIIVAILTLFETRRQRSASFRPRILVTDRQMVMSVNTAGVPCHLTVHVEDADDHFYVPDFKLDLTNVGLGPAISVSLSWKFNAKRLRSALLEESNELVDFRPVSADLPHAIQYRSPPNQDQGFNLLMDDDHKFSETWSFIGNEDNQVIDLPSTIYFAITFGSFFQNDEGKLLPYLTGKKPIAMMTIRFSDIANRLYEQQIDVFAKSKNVRSNSGVYAVGKLRFVVRNRHRSRRRSLVTSGDT